MLKGLGIEGPGKLKEVKPPGVEGRANVIRWGVHWRREWRESSVNRFIMLG